LEFAEYRIYPVVSNVWSTNDYSYYHQSIGGYSAAKMRIYQDLMDFGRADGMGVFARNIPDMLNARYFWVEGRLPEQYPFQNLRIVYGGQEQLIYENEQACGRAWFVGDYVQANSRDERFGLLKDQQFDVRQKAILETELSQEIAAPANDSVFVERLNPHEIALQTQNDATSLLVVSEVFYPIGWKAFIDGKETPLYKTNHVLRSLVVPAGNHKVELIFDPPLLRLATRISLFSTILAFVLFVIGIFFVYKKRTELA